MTFRANSTELLAALEQARKVATREGIVGLRSDNTNELWVVAVHGFNGIAIRVPSGWARKPGNCWVNNAPMRRSSSEAKQLAELLKANKGKMMGFSHFGAYLRCAVGVENGAEQTVVGTVAATADYAYKAPELGEPLIDAAPKGFWSAVKRAEPALADHIQPHMESINVEPDKNGWSRWYSCDGYCIVRQRVNIALEAPGNILLHRDLLNRASDALAGAKAVRVAPMLGDRNGLAIYGDDRRAILWRYAADEPAPGGARPTYPDVEVQFIKRWRRSIVARAPFAGDRLQAWVSALVAPTKVKQGQPEVKAMAAVYLAAAQGQIGAILRANTMIDDRIISYSNLRASEASEYGQGQAFTLVHPQRIASLVAVLEPEEPATVAITSWSVPKGFNDAMYLANGMLMIEQKHVQVYLMGMNDPLVTRPFLRELNRIQMEQAS